MTATTQRPETDDRTLQLRSANRFLVVTVIVLAALALTMGAWAIYQAATGDDATENVAAELPAAAAEALNNYNEAVLAADGNAMLDYVTEDFAFLSYGTEVQLREFRADYITKYYGDFETQVIGDQMVLGGGDTYIVAEPERATTPAQADGFSVYRLVQVDGVWLVDVHRFTGE